jgi:hypothetical protein
MLKVLYIWRDSIMGQVIHSFVKTDVECNFNALSFDVKPKDIFGGIG